MASAKEIVVKPITAAAANDLVRRVHYSGKIVPNSQLHFGVFLNGKLEGAMQFGPSMDKRKMLGLVEGSEWNSFLELNRMAFGEALPKNSESRAIAVALRLIKKHYPHIEWIVSFSDGTQCGDGTIYRASGFALTGINKNATIWEMPDGVRVASLTLTNGGDLQSRRKFCEKYGAKFSAKASMQPFKDIGAKQVEGFMLRYMYFLNPEARKRLTVPILPFSKIDEMGAGMYKGETVSIEARRQKQAMAVPTEQRRRDTDPDAP